jgi:hypothetical protein
MPQFGTSSLRARSQLHPLLQHLVDEAIKEADFKILDAVRGRLAQERAVRQGNSTVHFGNSAHNYVPAIAMDLFPAPYSWDDKQAFIHLQLAIIKPLAVKLKIPIRQGLDWNMNGVITDEHFVDMPHVELHPWRQWAKTSHLYEE